MAKPLDGIRVFDITLAGVGPWAGKLLAYLGADVDPRGGARPRGRSGRNGSRPQQRRHHLRRREQQ